MLALTLSNLGDIGTLKHDLSSVSVANLSCCIEYILSESRGRIRIVRRFFSVIQVRSNVAMLHH